MGLIWMAMFSLCCYQFNEAYTCCVPVYYVFR